MLQYSTSKDKIVAIRQLTHTLCLFYFNDVSPRELDLLCEIIMEGEVTRESKNSFMINYKTSKENTAQLLNRLTKKGILIPKKFRTGRELHPHFKDIKYIIEGKTDKYILLNFDADV